VSRENWRLTLVFRPESTHRIRRLGAPAVEASVSEQFQFPVHPRRNHRQSGRRHRGVHDHARGFGGASGERDYTAPGFDADSRSEHHHGPDGRGRLGRLADDFIVQGNSTTPRKRTARSRF